MLFSTLTLMIILLLAQTIMALATILSMKTNKDREKSSPFECGFNPFDTAWIPFSLRFFLIAVIFLIFDVEITLLLPIPMIMKTASITMMSYALLMFFIILTLGLYYEWMKGALEWSNLTYI